MTDKELIKVPRESAEWAKAHEKEPPITLSEDLNTAADRLEELLTPLPLTIGDKIRSMTDKELTNLLWQNCCTCIENIVPFCKSNDECYCDDLDRI